MVRLHAFFLPAVLALLPMACSKSATCALEGCSQNDAVVMAGDDKQAQDADAVADKKDDLEKKIDDILNRLGISEAMATLLNESIKLHEDRLSSLEKRTDVLEGSVSAVRIQLSHHQDDIKTLQKSLSDMQASFQEKLDALSEKEQKDVDDLHARIDLLEIDLQQSIADLDSDTQDAFRDILKAMAKERARVDAADKAIRDEAAKKLADLKADLAKKITELEKVDSKNRKELLAEIDRLDNRVDGVIVVSALVAQALWKELLSLQKDLNDLKSDSQEEFATLRGKIKTVSDKLKSEVARLDAKDLGIINDIIDLDNQQTKTQAAVADLDKRLSDFIAAQEAINSTIDNRLNKLSGSLTSLYSTVQDQIGAQAEQINTILTSLIPSLSARISALESVTIPALDAAITKLGSNLTTQQEQYTELQGQVNTLSSSFNAEIGDLEKDIAAINSALASKSSCALSDKYKEKDKDHKKNDWYQDLVCDSIIVLTIKVK